MQCCFFTEVGHQLHSDLKKFSASVQSGRWGTVAHAVSQLRQVESAIRWGWDLDRYRAGDRSSKTGEPTEQGQGKGKKTTDGDEHAINVETADEAIQSEFFWGMLTVLAHVSEWLLSFSGASIAACVMQTWTSLVGSWIT